MNFFNLPPLFPAKQKLLFSFCLEFLQLQLNFDYFRSCNRNSQISFFCNCLNLSRKINLKSKSLPVAVIIDVSVANDIALIAFLFFVTHHEFGSKCWASEALPPLP